MGKRTPPLNIKILLESNPLEIQNLSAENWDVLEIAVTRLAPLAGGVDQRSSALGPRAPVRLRPRGHRAVRDHVLVPEPGQASAGAEERARNNNRVFFRFSVENNESESLQTCSCLFGSTLKWQSARSCEQCGTASLFRNLDRHPLVPGARECLQFSSFS